VIEFELDRRPVAVSDDGISLLEALRDRLGVRSVKDGCSPQGQCGCCTVWVDGSPRVACVTPVGRVRGRQVTTIDGLPDAAAWANRFCATGGSQCGFCTPGIMMRLAALDGPERARPDAVRHALLAHLCRCTGWQPIIDACTTVDDPTARTPAERAAAERRAHLEGGQPQHVHRDVALGRGGFADDGAPADALVAVLDADGDWVVGDSLSEARRAAGTVQGRRSTAPVTWPIEVPPGHDNVARTLRTTWVEPAYLEPDASWCEPGGEPTSPLGNGGAFGGKERSPVAAAARRLADLHDRPVRAMFSREDTVRLGPKRPPVAGWVRADETGVLAVAAPETLDDRSTLRASIASVAPDLEVEFVEVVGPPTAATARAAGWAEAAVLVASCRPPEAPVVAPNGAAATATVRNEGGREVVSVSVKCGTPLDDAVLRSYCTGAAHMALGWVRSESLAVDERGVPLDLTIRSFGVLRAVDMPRVEVTIEPEDATPVNGSDAVFAAVAAAAWRAAGFSPTWPAGVAGG